MKSVRIWSYSGRQFAAFRFNTDQNSSEYEHFLGNAGPMQTSKKESFVTKVSDF